MFRTIHYSQSEGYAVLYYGIWGPTKQFCTADKAEALAAYHQEEVSPKAGPTYRRNPSGEYLPSDAIEVAVSPAEFVVVYEDGSEHPFSLLSVACADLRAHEGRPSDIMWRNRRLISMGADGGGVAHYMSPSWQSA